MEFFDLYTKDRIPTGKKIMRGEPIPKGYYRLVVHICIFNSKGEMLIQRRSGKKKFAPGMWDISVGGCVTAGETSAEGAHRELFEELGIDISFENIRPYMTTNFDEGFADVYFITKDIDTESLVLQKEEVTAVKWACEAEILSMISDKTFIPYINEKIKYFFAARNHRNSFSEAN